MNLVSLTIRGAKRRAVSSRRDLAAKKKVFATLNKAQKTTGRDLSVCSHTHVGRSSSQVWWHMPEIPALKGQDCVFQALQGNCVSKVLEVTG